MIVDGKALAAEILGEVSKRTKARSALRRAPKLTIFTCAPTFATKKYLALKTKKAASVGIETDIQELRADVTTEVFVARMHEVLGETDGIVVQLPLPVHLDRETILAAIPASADPDGFSFGVAPDVCLPPVVGAIDEIAKRNDIAFGGKSAVVVGSGRLVGQPAAHFLRHAGATVTVLPDATADTAPLTTADVIVSGAGVPHLVTPELVREGVLIFDAGTSEDNGKLAGDVHPEVADKAALFTPVPGGIGPITIALLLRNLADLAERQ